MPDVNARPAKQTPRSSRQSTVTRLIQWIYRVDPEIVLNPAPASREPQPDFDLELTQQLRTLKSLFYSAQQFDYLVMRESREMTALVAMLSRLRAFDPAALPTAERKRAFWINLYNILILQAVVVLEVSSSVRDVSAFFNRAAYMVNQHRFSANDIEHGILRANAGYPFLPGKQIPVKDKRLRYALPLDPRIHFALNCAALSCPPIAAYDGDNLNNQLDMAARAFVNSGGVEVELSSGKLRMSPIFLWYRRDFAGIFPEDSAHDAVVKFIAQYMSDGQTRQALLESPRRFRIGYLRYDWTLNRLPVRSPVSL